MSSVRNRLAKLEETHGSGSSRLIVMRSHRNMQDGECNAFLAGQGVIVGRSDTVVCFATIYESRDGSDAPEAEPPSLLSVQPHRSGRL